jgi:hypothetical protein
MDQGASEWFTKYWLHEWMTEGLIDRVTEWQSYFRLAIYRQAVRLDARPLETHNQRFVFKLNSCGNSAYVTSSLTRRWVSEWTTEGVLYIHTYCDMTPESQNKTLLPNGSVNTCTFPKLRTQQWKGTSFQVVSRQGSIESETVKYGRESHGTQTRQWLPWRGKAAIVNDRPVLLSERPPRINRPATVWQ